MLTVGCACMQESRSAWLVHIDQEIEVFFAGVTADFHPGTVESHVGDGVRFIVLYADGERMEVNLAPDQHEVLGLGCGVKLGLGLGLGLGSNR